MTKTCDNTYLAAFKQPTIEAIRALDRAVLGLESVFEAAESGEIGHLQMLEGPEAPSAAMSAMAGISHYRYDEDDAVNKIPPVIGVVGTNRAGLSKVAKANEAKLALKTLLRPLSSYLVQYAARDENGGHVVKYKPAVRQLMTLIDEAEFSVLAACRVFPVLEVAPQAITFTRSRNNVIYKYTRKRVMAELYDLLETTDDSAVREDIDRVKSTRDDHFAWVKPMDEDNVQYRVRANVRFAGLDKAGRGRKVVACTQPLFWPARKNSEPPKVRFPTQHGGRKRRIVRKGSVDPKRLLTTMPIHQYR